MWKNLSCPVHSQKQTERFFDLERLRDREALKNPELTLSPLTGTVIIDKIQLEPGLFEALRVLSDRRPQPAEFLILGSASPNLIKGCAETLAGRVEFIDLRGFTLSEVGNDRIDLLWQRGCFPDSFLANSEKDSYIWRENFIRTFLERDLPAMGINIPPTRMRRFWTMLAHYHGCIWNASDLANSLGVAHTTTRAWLDILTGAFVIRQLPPWYENLGKRIVKSPKVYLRDSGLLHALLAIEYKQQMIGHPKLGASWKGFAMEEILALIENDKNAYFWSVHSGSELDLLVFLRGKRLGFEFKYSDAPSMTKSMRVVTSDLNLDHLYVVYPGEASYRLDEKTEVIPLEKVSKRLQPPNEGF